jgi:hypothetical protein
MEKICKQCKKEYSTKSKNQKFCSLICRYKSQIKPLIYNKCVICNKIFNPHNYHKNQICCSNKCRIEFRKKRIEIKCNNCGIIFKVKPFEKDKKYCCQDCFNNRSNKICVCNTCGKEFKISKSKRLENQIFCSRECFKNRKPKLLNKKCKICGMQILGTGRNEYCSLECKKVGLIKKECINCKNEFNTKKKKSLFCSRKCKNIYQMGENHPNFNNYSSLEPYDKNFNKIFKKSIRERDGCCLLCNISLEDLKLLKKRNHIHHINYNKELTCKENCCTLCISCHGKTSNINRNHWTKFFQSVLSERYGYNYSENGDIIINLQDSCKEVN